VLRTDDGTGGGFLAATGQLHLRQQRAGIRHRSQEELTIGQRPGARLSWTARATNTRAWEPACPQVSRSWRFGGTTTIEPGARRSSSSWMATSPCLKCARETRHPTPVSSTQPAGHGL